MALPFRYVVIDACPVPRRLARYVRELKRAVPGAVLQSCYRGKDAERLLHRYGKHSQAELYAGFMAHKPGFNPANPPGFSSHELRSDGGVFFHKPRGAKLEWWQCGMDWDDAHISALERAASRRGWRLARPYSAGSEYHHLGFARRPR